MLRSPLSHRIVTFVLICVVLVGMGLRFVRIDEKPSWLDESITAMRIAGSSWSELHSDDQREWTVQEFRTKYFTVDSESSLSRVLESSREGLHVPPLYYLLANFWARLLGSSMLALRSLPALLSCMAVVLAFLLCRQLEGSTRWGWFAAALLAVSPIQVVYAQEARSYALFVLLALASSMALVAAMRHGSWWRWAIYGFSIGIALYGHLLSLGLILGHGISVLALRPESKRTVLFRFSLAVVLSLLLFSPQLYELLRGAHVSASQLAWLEGDLGLFESIAEELRVFSLAFIDFGNEWRYETVRHKLLYLFVSILTTGLFLYFVRRASGISRWLVLGPTLAFLCYVVYLVAKGMMIPSTARYQIVLLTAWVLGVSYAISRLMNAREKAKRAVAALGMLVLILAGLTSSLRFVSAGYWWSKGGSEGRRVIAGLIRNSPQPTILTCSIDDALAHTFSLPDRALIRLIDVEDTLRVSLNRGEVILLGADDQQRERLEQQTGLRTVHVPPEYLRVFRFVAHENESSTK